jgi:hypothetical protein
VDLEHKNKCHDWPQRNRELGQVLMGAIEIQVNHGNSDERWPWSDEICCAKLNL